MNRRRFLISLSNFIPALVLCALIAGCSGGSDVGNPESITFASDDALMAYLVDQYAQSAMPEAEKTALSDDGTAAPAASDETGFSQTNVQETGVDESDKVKTDGTYIYTAGKTAVSIIDTLPEGTMKKVSRIEVKGTIDSLYLFEDILVVLYTPENGTGSTWTGEVDIKPIDIGMPYWIPVGAKIGILIADIRSPENPLTIRDIQTDGFLVASRLTGGRLHVISQFFPDIPRIDLWYNGSETDRSDTVAANKKKLNALTLDDFIPACQEYDSAGLVTADRRLVATQDFLCPENPGGGTIVSIITADLSNPEKDIDSVGFIADVHHVYASTENLYLVSAEYNNIQTLTEADSPDYQTRIYQFDLSSPTVTYSAAGQVPGRTLNQFSLGEYNEILRIATTTGNVWDGSAKNHVYCLESENEKLTIIGRLEGLAPGEKLYAARFIKDKGYLVTFVEIDPLFTLDLSDPRNPTAVGELKVPGYSTYIHPLDNHVILTIGKDTSLDGNSVWYQGLQMSLFDISDFSTPKLIAVEKIGDRGTESEALFNHKALTFWPGMNLMALPVNLYEHLTPPSTPWEYGTQTFNGLYVYQITDKKNFTYLGRMPMAPEQENFYYYPDWIRGIFIDQSIYAVSADAIKKADIESVETIEERIDLQE